MYNKDLPLTEELVNKSLLMQMKAKMEQKYKDNREVLNLYNMAVDSMMLRDDDGGLFPDLYDAVNCMSRAACLGMAEAKMIMKNLEHLAKYRVPLDQDGYSDECIKALNLNRTLQMCLESEDEWALDTMCRSLSHIAELYENAGHATVVFDVYLVLYGFMRDVYYAEGVEAPYSLSMYMNAKEIENRDSKMSFFMVLIGKMYSCLIHDKNDAIKNKDRWLNILNNTLSALIAKGLNTFGGNLVYKFVDDIWKTKDRKDGLYHLLLVDKTDMTLDRIAHSLIKRICNLDSLVNVDYGDSVFSWHDSEWEGMQSALAILKEGNSKLSEKVNAFYEALSFGLFTAVLARRGDVNLDDNIKRMWEKANELQSNVLFDLVIFSVYVYYTNQGNYNDAYGRAIEFIMYSERQHSEVNDAISERQTKGIAIPIH